MKIYLTFMDGDPVVRTTQEEAEQLLQDKYATYSNSQPLAFERFADGDPWTAYDWSSTDADGAATKIPEKIWEVEVPVTTPHRAASTPWPGDGVHLELRITTRDKVVSLQELESEEIWDSPLGKGFIVEQFAARAARAIGQSINEE